MVAHGRSSVELTDVTDTVGNSYTVDVRNPRSDGSDAIGITHTIVTTSKALTSVDFLTATLLSITSGGLGLAAAECQGVTGIGATTQAATADSDTITLSLRPQAASGLIFAAAASYGADTYTTTPTALPCGSYLRVVFDVPAQIATATTRQVQEHPFPRLGPTR